jgi:hypothetical protein
MAEIPLTQGNVAIVDDAVVALLMQNRWIAARDHRRQQWYAQANVYRQDGVRTTISMHRLLMGNPPGKMVDHRNGNGLDNRRQNLRVSTPSENSRNMLNCKSHSSRFKGVSWHSGKQKWTAQIMVDRRLIHLGTYADEVAAARVYNEAALRHFGEFANLNEIPQEALR